MTRKIALITGASRGLGKSAALHLAAQGVDIIGTYHSAAAEAHYAKGERLRTRLNEIAQKHRITLQFTGIGSMIQPHFRTGQLLRRYDASAAEEALLEPRRANVLAAVCEVRGAIGIAACDISTGRMELEECAPEMLGAALAATSAS